MEAKEKSLKEIFGGAPQKLVVPFFQRRYVWKEENWNELLNSLEENEDTPVFLGSIIIKWSENRDPTEATIVDGQQRLTTLSLLTKAIYDEYIDKNNIKSLIQNVLFYKRNATEDEKNSEIKIVHSRVDVKEYKKLIMDGLLNNETTEVCEIEKNCQGQISKCYLHFRKYLNTKTQEQMSKILNTMYDDNNKMLVRVELKERDVNEQSIFDTINRAGSRLNTADIVKNNLYKRFLEKCHGDSNKEDEVCKIYDEKWDELFYSENGPNEWDKERYFGNVSRSNLEFLLYCVATIKWGKSEAKDLTGKLENVYQKATENFDFNQFNDLMCEIYEYAKIFKLHVLELTETMSDYEKKEKKYFYYNEDVNRLLMVLEVFGVQMFYPYVLKIIKDAVEEKQNENENYLENKDLVAKSKMLESFIVRRRICGSSVSDYSSKCSTILEKGVEKLFDRTSEDKINFNNNEIRVNLKNVKSDTARLLLFWIELSRKNNNSDIDGLTYTYTLEHIMPQKWEDNWPTQDEQERIDHINDFGNMTLLKNSLNIIVRNANFARKVEGIPAEGRKKAKEGYEGNIALSITDEIVKQYRNDNVWDENHIDQRRTRLSNEIINIWPMY